MVNDIQFIIDGADRGQPIDVEKFGCNIIRDKDLNIVYVKFDNPLTFNGGVYSYIYQKLKDNDYCNLIDVVVNYRCQGNFNLLAKGYIDVSDCEFNLDKCELSCKMIDDSFASRINNNKAIPFYTNSSKTKNLYDVVAPLAIRCQAFTPGIGNYDFFIRGHHVYNFFNHLVNCISDNNVEFQSDYFSTGQGNKFFITNGIAIRTLQKNPTKSNFKDAFEFFNKKQNLGIGFARTPSGKPILFIEEIEYFYNTTTAVTLLDVANVIQYFDKEKFFSTVNFGTSQFLEEFQCDNSSVSCTYPQVEFRGNRLEKFGVLGECNLDVTLDLSTSEIIYDFNVIEDVLIYKNEEYDQNMFVIECEPSTIDNTVMVAKRADPLGLGLWIYNGGLTNEATANEWISGVPNSITSYLDPYPDADLIAQISSDGNYYNGTVDGCGFGLPPINSRPTAFKVLSTNVGFAKKTSYSTANDALIGFNDVIVDVGGNWVNDTANYNTYYKAPAPLIGDFKIEVAIGGSPNNQSGLVVYTRIVLKRFSEDGAFMIQRRDGNFYNFFARETNCSNYIQMEELFTGVFMNLGDRMYVDVEAYLLVTPTFGGDQMLRISSSFSSYYTRFTTQNMVSIKGGELQEYNAEEFKANLYKFDLPISHQDIAQMINFPSNAINLGRTPDPLNVKMTHINNVNIASIIRKDANFELISSQ